MADPEPRRRPPATTATIAITTPTGEPESPTRAAPRAAAATSSPAPRACRFPVVPLPPGPPVVLVAAAGPDSAPRVRVLPSLVDDGAVGGGRRPARRRRRSLPPAGDAVGPARRDGAARSRGRRCVAAAGRWAAARSSPPSRSATKPGAPPVPYRQPSTDTVDARWCCRRTAARVRPASRAGRGAEVRPVLATRTDEARLVGRVAHAVQLADRGALAGEAVGHRVGARELQRVEAGDRSVEADRHRDRDPVRRRPPRASCTPARRRRRARPVRGRAPPRPRPRRAGPAGRARGERHPVKRGRHRHGLGRRRPARPTPA